MASTASVIRNYAHAARQADTETARAFWTKRAEQTFTNRHGVVMAKKSRTRKAAQTA